MTPPRLPSSDEFYLSDDLEELSLGNPFSPLSNLDVEMYEEEVLDQGIVFQDLYPDPPASSSQPSSSDDYVLPDINDMELKSDLDEPVGEDEIFPDPDEAERQVFQAAGPWNRFGYSSRPDWWHYWEERNPVVVSNLPEPNIPRPVSDNDDQSDQDHSDASEPRYSRADVARDVARRQRDAQRASAEEKAAVDQAEAAEPDDPAPPPPPSREEQLRFMRELERNLLRDALEQSASDPSDSGPWLQYWAARNERQRMFNEADPPVRPTNFHAPPLQDGDWNRSTHVSNLLKNGFNVSVDITKRGKMPPKLKCSSQAERQYITQMVADGILEPGEVKMNVDHFWLYKPGKLRLIFNGKKTINSAVKPPPKFNMKSHPTLANYSQKYSWHAGEDLSNCFFSIPLEEQTRQYFGIRTSLGNFRYTRMPFGFSWSPFIVHLPIDECVKRALEQGIPCMHYSDDIHIFGHSEEQVREYARRIREIFSKAGWVFNFDKSQKPSQQFKALGFYYDLVKKTIQLPAATLISIRGQHAKLLNNDATVTRKVLASFIGSIIFAAKAYPGLLAHLSSCLAFVKAGTSWNQRYRYKFFAPYLEKVLTFMEGLAPLRLQVHDSTPVQVYTDATNTQISLVMPSYEAASRIPYTQIYRSEALAICWLLKQDLPNNTLIRCDNEALVNALKKGRSNIYEANLACKLLLQVRCQNKVVTCKHIRTHINPADAPSRRRLGPVGYFVSPRLALLGQ